MDPKLVSGALALLAIPILLPKGQRPSALLILLFTASGWNYLVNAKIEYGRIHYHDAGHYYLGSRYFAELGYFHLYDGILLALSEPEAASGIPEQVRDLRDNRMRSSGELLAKRRLSAADFDPGRWREFRADAEMIAAGLGPKLETFFTDHGYNPTPVWTWIVRPVARLIPAGSAGGLLWLTWIDPLLLLAALALSWWAVGRDAALIAGSYLFLAFGTVNWIGGSFCRYLWLVLLISGFALLKKQRYFLAGALLASSAALRIFPVLFLVPLTLKILRGICRRRKIPRRHLRLAAGATAAVFVAAAGATAALGGGAWQAFFEKVGAYLKLDPSNAIGLQAILETSAQLLGAAPSSRPWSLPILAVSGSLAWIVARAASRRNDVQALAAGAVLCFLIFDVAGYYYVFLAVPLLVETDCRRRAAFFAVEAACYLAHFTLGVEQHVLFLIRSLTVGLLLCEPWLERGVREVAGLTSRFRAVRIPC